MSYNNGCEERHQYFSNPNITWAPQGYAPVPLGDAAWRDVTRVHNVHDAIIQALETTPATVTLDAQTTGAFEEVSVLATGRVNLAKGFNSNQDGRVSISVGPEALMKRGAGEKGFFVSDPGGKEAPAIPADFDLKTVRNGGSLEVFISLEQPGEVEAALFDLKGDLRTERVFLNLGHGRNSFFIDLKQTPGGVFYLRILVDGKRLYHKLFIKG